MTDIIKPKARRSNAEAPTTAALEDGEFAINVPSKTIYYRAGEDVVPVANYTDPADISVDPVTDTIVQRDGDGRIKATGLDIQASGVSNVSSLSLVNMGADRQFARFTNSDSIDVWQVHGDGRTTGADAVDEKDFVTKGQVESGFVAMYGDQEIFGTKKFLGLTAAGSESTIIGTGASSAASKTVAIGEGAGNSEGTEKSTTMLQVTAIGYQALGRVTGMQNVALGHMAGSELTTGTANTLIGRNAGSPFGDPSRSLISGGANVHVGANTATNNTAAGNSVVVGFAATGNSGSVVVGASADDEGGGSVVVGRNAKAAGGGSKIAIGTNSSVLGADNTAMAIGRDSSAAYALSIALGAYSETDSVNTLSIGNDTIKRRIVNVADGTEPDDATTLGQIYSINLDIATTLGGGATVGLDGRISSPSYSIQGQSYGNIGDALDAVNNALDEGGGGEEYPIHPSGPPVDGESAPVGTNRTSIAIGFNSSTGNHADSVAVGHGSSVSSVNSTAIGSGAKDFGYGVAIGRGAETTNMGGTAIGYIAKSSYAAVAVGRNANATHSNSAAMGFNSRTSKENQISFAGLNASTHLASTPRIISGVADPAVAQDAVNLQTLEAKIEDSRRMQGRHIAGSGSQLLDTADLNAIVELTADVTIGLMLPSGLGEHRDAITIVNSSLSGTINVTRDIGVAIFSNGTDEDLTVEAGSMVTIIRSFHSDRWIA